VVQEALTNARKHGGDGATATVRLEYGERELAIDVRDDGRGAANGHHGGHGLVGMRERVTLYGGQLDSGPVDGGYRVRASLPIGREP
jgi:signal transduction histidine kinase